MADEQKTTPLTPLEEAERDARLFGSGFLVIRQDGAERVDPARVVIKPDDPAPGWAAVVCEGCPNPDACERQGRQCADE